MAKTNADNLQGFLPLNRKLFEHKLWKEKREYSKAEAWIDLLRRARWENSEATFLLGLKTITYGRGQLVAALGFLSSNWSWSKSKVDRFLTLLEEEGMISRNVESGTTIITLTNYESYNGRVSNVEGTGVSGNSKIRIQKSEQQAGRESGQQNADPQAISSDSRDAKRDAKRNARGKRAGNARDYNKESINKEEEVTGAVAPAPTPEEQETFLKFQKWIETNASNVSRMKEPVTIDQFIKLRKKIDRVTLQRLLINMHNWKPLLKQNVSAYLTIVNWSQRDDKERQKTGASASGATGKVISLAAEIHDIRAKGDIIQNK